MQYVVFAVDNADRLTLMGPPKDGAPNLKPVALSYIQAPHQGRRTANGDFTDDEPYAFEALELIRNKFIGKTARFKEDYFIESQQRIAGRLTLVDGGADASCLLLEQGLAGMGLKIPQGMDQALFQKYVALMRKAFLAGKGIFAPEKEQLSHVRHLCNLSAEDLAAKAKEVEGRSVKVRVERAISGTALVVMNSDSFGDAQIPVHMTGVSLKGVEEQFAASCKFFAEKYLLHRCVTAYFDGADSFGNLLVSIVSPKGSFQEELLRQGLCKVVPTTAALSHDVDKLLAAEQGAKDSRRGIWHNYVPPASAVKTVEASPDGTEEEKGAAPGPAAKVRPDGVPTFLADGQPGPAYTGKPSFTGTLVQIIHGDTLVIRDEESKQQVRVGLAGVRCSKAITRDPGGNAPESRVTYAEYSWEAREFIRTRYVGWRVTVDVEYARMMPETKEMRPVAVITHAETGVNIGAALLESGYATFFLGKNAICRCAGELQAAEAEARAAGRGIHSGETPLPTTVLEMSRLGESRSRYYLSFLQRGMQGNRPPVLRGVVDVVVSGNSVRVHIPKEHFQIPLRLAGVIAPAGPAQGHKPDPFCEESRNMLVDLLQHREVNVQIFSSDRAGNFIGCVLLDDGTNASVALVRAGLATVGNADRLPFANQLQDAEDSAKAAQLFVWGAAEKLPQRAAKLESKKAAKGGAFIPITGNEAAFVPCVRSDVAEDGLSVYLQPVSEEASETMETIKGLLEALIESTNADPYKPSVGQMVAVQYKADKQWYRGKVLRLTQVNAETVAQVHFMDFGNTQLTNFKCLRSIPRLADYAELLDTPALAFHARLAYIKQRLPPEAEAMAYEVTFNYTDGDELLAKPEYKDAAGVVYYTVAWSEKEASLNEELLQSGAAFLDKRAATVSPAYERHAAASNIARKSHIGIWAYGDADEDDE